MRSGNFVSARRQEELVMRRAEFVPDLHIPCARDGWWRRRFRLSNRAIATGIVAVQLTCYSENAKPAPDESYSGRSDLSAAAAGQTAVRYPSAI